eukprot:GHVR01092500.1.p1 GENE.GHVR01092500.1~~GHVR01092500.1.p1  ORF type:complete len:253 (+),score=15.06 GHVR01092500.1:280-1038(+)
MRKVLYALSLQLLVISVIISLICLVPLVADFIKETMVIFCAGSSVSLVFIVLLFCEEAARRFPINIILLGMLTLSLGVILGLFFISLENIVIVSFVGTVVVVLGLSGFSLTTNMDFSGLIIYKLAAVLAVFSISIVIIICDYYFNIELTLFNKIKSVAFLVFFSMYIVCDIQLLQRRFDRQLCLGADDYVFGCLTIFGDMWKLFFEIAGLFKTQLNRDAIRTNRDARRDANRINRDAHTDVNRINRDAHTDA